LDDGRFERAIKLVNGRVFDKINISRG